MHGVVQRQARRNRPAGAVDVEPDVSLGVLVLQEEQLGDQRVDDLILDGCPEQDDALLSSRE